MTSGMPGDETRGVPLQTDTPARAPDGGAAVAATAAGPSGPPPARRWTQTAAARRIGGVALVVVVAGSAIYGANLFGIRDRVEPVAKIPTPAAHGVPPSSNGQPVLASYPWWQAVTTLQGTGSETQSVVIGGGALQWRVQWSCQTGHLAVSAHPGAPSQLVNAACPGNGEQITVSTGTVTLDVTATGPWTLRVDQQVDVPLEQTPLPAMSAPGSVAISTGTFYPIDQNGSGTATIYRLADGSYALRLDKFFASPNTGLQIQLSTQPSPKSDGDVTGSQIAVVVDLNQTAGSFNFTIPSGIDPTRYHSLVVWCVNLRTAYAAANLTSPG